MGDTVHNGHEWYFLFTLSLYFSYFLNEIKLFNLVQTLKYYSFSEQSH